MGLYLASNDYGARLTPDFALNIVSVPTTLLFELILVGAPVALLLWRLPRRDIPSGLLVKRSALLSPAAVATITLAVGHFSDGP